MNTTPRKFYAADLPASGQPAKKLTPMGTLYTALHNTHPSQWIDILMKDKSALLEAEREMVVNARTTSPILLFTSDISYAEESAGYFTQNYRQQ